MADISTTAVTFRSIRELFRDSYISTAKERLRFYLFVFLFIVANLIELAVPWAIGYTLGVYVKEGFTDEAFAKSLWGIGLYILLRFLYTIFHHLARYLQNTVAYTSRMHTIQKLYASFMDYPLRWHINHHSGENISKLYRATGAVESTIGSYVWQIIEGVVKVLFASIAIFALDFWVAVNVIVVGFLSIFAMVYFNRRLTIAYRQNNIFANRINRICVDYLHHIVTVKILGLEKAAKHYLEKQEEEGRLYAKRIAQFSELKWSTNGLGYGLVIGSSLIIYFYGHKELSKPLEIAQVYVLLNYLDRIFQAIGSFTGYYSGIIEASIAYEDASHIYSESENLLQNECEETLSPTWKKLSLSELNFQYVEGETRGLNSLSFSLQRGEKIAVVGPSGGGKSTLMKVLAGLLRTESYKLEVDPQRELNSSLDTIANSTLLVPQEPEIFSETLFYNITIGEEFSNSDLEKTCELCKLTELIGRLPNGIHTDLAEKGLNLSVGEKQRVALARGLLRVKRKALVLLDEPTSSLDPRTEREIFVEMLATFHDRTVLTACHRLNLVALFDRIIYIANGEAKESGTFHELIQQRGLFYRAWIDYEQGVDKLAL
jgi:ATP-binding cassette, subfamily B, bacterial